MRARRRKIRMIGAKKRRNSSRSTHEYEHRQVSKSRSGCSDIGCGHFTDYHAGRLDRGRGHFTDYHAGHSGRGRRAHPDDHPRASDRGHGDCTDQHRSAHPDSHCRVAPVVEEDQRPPRHPRTIQPSYSISHGIHDSTLILLFDHYVASSIWKGKEHHILACETHKLKTSLWKAPKNNHALSIVVQAPLFQLRDVYGIAVDHGLNKEENGNWIIQQTELDRESVEKNLEKCNMDFRKLKTAVEKLQRPEDIARCYFVNVLGNTLFVDRAGS
ncbi:hypothetical protein M9H77_17778 [Catharanthus roseus]|uniref:Uncharacterized protein n=1 Tax=Catharanthus roseus TaxID=4058 RepID=A0ACC0B5J1_CATRO|nr:hypothetical protein M9H77_17778 [Catharanthus roseus]